MSAWKISQALLRSDEMTFVGFEQDTVFLAYPSAVDEEKVTVSFTVLSFSCVCSLSCGVWQEHEEPQSGLLTCFASLVPDVYGLIWGIRRLNEWLNPRRFQFMFMCLFNYSHSPSTHDIMENFVGSRSAEGNAALLSLFWESVGIHRSKNTDFNHRIPRILSPSALWCEWHLSQADLGCEAEKQRYFRMD